MSSVLGWYGPLIDLSTAANHIGHFVQLLVFIHRSNPVQYKSRKGGELLRRDIHVGDDTRPFFSISIWQKQMGSLALAGDVVFLQNVKITKFGNFVDARTVQCSSLVSLIHPYQSLVSKGVDELVAECRVGVTTKEKLRKVIEWVQRAGSSFCSIQRHCELPKTHLSRNWRLPEEEKSRDCFSLSEAACLTKSCKAVFYASVGEIFIPFNRTTVSEPEKEKMFISRRLCKTGDSSLATDLICIGCLICGSPLDLENGRSILEKDSAPLYCSESSNRLHAISFIYRPFMLYVSDESDNVALLVKNKAAELLFGNITAERVYSSFREQENEQNAEAKDAVPNLELKGEKHCLNKINFYLVWLVLLKALLHKGKNSALKFEVYVDVGLDRENGRFEMTSVCIPSFRTKFV
ncbi:hypothetical protein UlMin_034583 [Ulmus minor]